VLDPQHEERGENADEEDPAPAGVGKNQAGDKSGECVADGPAALHDTEGASSPGRGPGFGDQCRACVPFAAHAEAEEKAEDGEREDAGGKAAGEGEDGVRKDAGGEHAAASEAVSQDAEEQSA
jgi:hypothetical protein